MKRIAIQGIKGSYHDMAAHYFFHNEDIELICCSTFEEVFATVKDDSTILGIAAIENTHSGSPVAQLRITLRQRTDHRGRA